MSEMSQERPEFEIDPEFTAVNDEYQDLVRKNAMSVDNLPPAPQPDPNGPPSAPKEE